jgi:hypothetical protein
MKFWTRTKHRRKSQRSAWQMVVEQLEARALLTAPVVTPIADVTPNLHFQGLV